MPNNLYRSQQGRLGFKPMGADWNGTINALLTLSKDDASVIYNLWVDSSGRLRIKAGVPTSDTDGAVVGSQA